MRKFLISLVFFGATLGPAMADQEALTRWAPDSIPTPVDPTALVAEVKDGKLPPAAERLPKVPLVMQTTEKRAVGKSGGDIRMLVARTKDSRLMAVYGYARLVGYDENFDLVPDILEKVEVTNNSKFVLHLRPGHRWSDGHPFTSEDFRYYWEDVANNEELSPTGPPIDLLVDGQKPTVTYPDETTVIYEWEKPNPFFLTIIAQATPFYLYRPAHYLKEFHIKYAAPAELRQLVDESGKPNWASLHNSLGNLYRMDNPALPVLQPWTIVTPPPTQRMIFQRNPYFHRIDETGMQLPYMDRWILEVVSPGLITAKTAAGDTDLQSRGISFDDYTLLKQSEAQENYSVFLWKTVRPSEYALYPNLNAADANWRELLRDTRFRRALSMGVNREDINQVIYYGLGLPGNQGPLPESKLYKQEYRTDWAQHDPAAANKLLDEMGLTKRDSDGIRLMPDGTPIQIIAESAGESTQPPDILELIKTHWKEIGIGIFNKPSERLALRNRIFSGEAVMSIWFGFENGIPTAETAPGSYAPVHQQNYQWPRWGQYRETKGQAGVPVDMPRPKELLELYEQWESATSTKKQRAIWEKMLKINAEEVYTIGLVAQIPQPVVVHDNLRNVPKDAIYNWEPGAQFGVYRTDSFYWEK